MPVRVRPWAPLLVVSRAPAAPQRYVTRESTQLPAGVTVISIHPMYSAVQVGVATLLGGPLGGAWLMALNYRRLDARRGARVALALGGLATAAVLAIGLDASYPTMRLLVMLLGIVGAGLAELVQGADYVRHVVLGGRRGSSWRAVAVGTACLPIHLVPIVGAAVVQASRARTC